MAITVVKYPQGHIVSTSAVAATVSSSSGALVTKATHDLVTGDYIYVISSLSAYNGYWYVNKNDANTFWLREYPTASNVAFVNSGSITYYKSQLTHGWNSVHLPIIYKLKSDSWPINGVDTARTITTFSNWNGYTALILSGDVKSSGDASALESVVLSGTSVDGVYKIIQWSSDTAIVIDLLYSAANVLSSGTCQYYYLNYHAKIKIYAGLTGTHYWAASKPYELMATVKLIPDSTGVMTLNVSEYVMGKLEILKNDLQEDELPNNLDAFCRVYISVAEAYDDSNMYTISEYTSSYTDDTTEIYAVNAKLPFQTRSGSAMDDYVPYASTQKFLTSFTRPTLFAGHYFDVSYILNQDYTTNLFVKRDLYRKSSGNYSLINSILDSVTDYDQGVYRYPRAQSASLEDRIDLTLVNVNSIPPYASWANFSTGTAWSTTPDVSLSSNTVSTYYRCALSGPVGVTVSFNYTFQSNKAAGAYQTDWGLYLMDSSGNVVQTLATETRTTNGTTSGTATAVTTSAFSYLAFRATTEVFAGLAVTDTVTVTQDTTYDLTFELTETKTIDVVSPADCHDTTGLYLTWLNYLGGYDYWYFSAQKKYSVDVTENKTQTQNIYNQYPKSYSELAQSIDQQSVRKTKNIVKVTSQYLTKAQVDGIAWIVSSPLVQILTDTAYGEITIQQLRTVLVDTSTLAKYQDRDNLYSISFNITYTDELPVQSL